MLTSSQQLALNTLHHLSVTANAGSGKTMVLVERYIDILTSGKAYVSEVVALTFTDKAASELRRKISEGIAKRIAEERHHGNRQRLETIREQLAGAMIGTIHWFCKKILQEYPVEANVDASFTVVEGVDQKMLIEQSIRETFRSILKDEPYTAKREELFAVLRALGKPTVMTIVEQLAARREIVQRWIRQGGIYSLSDDEVLEQWRNHLSNVVNAELSNPQLLKDIRDVVSAATGKDALTVSATYKAFEKTSDARKRSLLLVELLEKMLTDGKLRKKLFGDKADNQLAEQAARLKRADDILSPLLTFVAQANDDWHRRLLSQTRLLLELYQNATERYQEKKFESAQLDFDDLQFFASELLRNDRVRQKLAHRFKYIMVDEYQDTNSLQYEILLSLVDDLSRGNLFIVGDPKQSIYGFRNADVAVFDRTKREISSVSGNDSVVVLNDSFRLLRDIVAFVNLVFAPLMKESASEFDVAYEPLVRGRQNSASGRVELLLRRPAEDVEGKESSDVISEGEFIAQRIMQLHAVGYEVYDKNEKPNPVQFRDVAILLRSRNGLADIEEAFVRHNIPYLVSGGVGYFQTQGIYDFYNYFKFLLNQDDDIALAGVLRSPFFNVSDAELFEAGFGRRTLSLWEEANSLRVKQKKLTALLRAVEMLNSDLEIATRLPIAELVERIIDQTNYAGFVAGTNRSAQITANIEKLKRLARRYEEQGFKTLYDFVGRLSRLIDEEEQEGQAAIDVFADAVKIMTIHAAKGLEFPVVIVPSLERNFRYDGQPFIDEGLGVAFASGEGEDANAPIAEFLKRRSNQRTVAEEKRILYVACTRARDLLILSGEHTKSRTSRNYLNWILDGLRVDDNILTETISFNVATPFLEIGHDHYVRKTEEHTLHVHRVRPETVLGGRRIEQPKLKREGEQRLLIDPLHFAPRGEMFSASKIRTYIECPSLYYLRYVAGLPTSPVHSAHDTTDDEHDVTIPAELRGRAFHYVMQHIDDLTAKPMAIRNVLSQFISQDSLSIISEPSIEVDAIVELVLTVVQSKFWDEVKRGTEARTEFTVMAKLGKDFLTGTMDRIYRDENDVWTILDYKTDSVSRSTVEEKSRNYEAQLRFYSLLIRKTFAASEVRSVLFFSSLPESPIRFSYSHTDLDSFELDLVATIQKIHTKDFRRSNGICSNCPFAPQGCAKHIH
jgi:ATP-dependent helicase/nuclease subunit A